VQQRMRTLVGLVCQPTSLLVLRSLRRLEPALN
jgi:hypothetical protein